MVEAKASKYSTPATPVGITCGPRRASSTRVVPFASEVCAWDSVPSIHSHWVPFLPVDVVAACQPISIVCVASLTNDHGEYVTEPDLSNEPIRT